jgi:hypothetical protein
LYLLFFASNKSKREREYRGYRVEDSSNEEGEKEEEKRPYFSLPA